MIKKAAWLWMKRTAAVTALATLGFPLGAQELAPLRIIVSLPAGGGVDTMARLVAYRLAEKTGRNVVVENKPGASGTIAAKAVISASPTYLTILASGNQEITIAPGLIKDPAYQPSKDLHPLVQVGTVASVLFAKAGARWADPQVFTQSLRQPLQVGVGIPGVGTPMHLSLVAVAKENKGDFLPVPYKGAPDVIRGVLAADTPYGTAGLPAILPFIKNGQAVGVAVLGAHTSAQLPGVEPISKYIQTSKEIPQISYGFFAPASLPESVRQQLEAELKAVLQEPEVKAKFVALGIEGDVLGGAAYAQDLARQTVYYAKALDDIQNK